MDTGNGGDPNDELARLRKGRRQLERDADPPYPGRSGESVGRIMTTEATDATKLLLMWFADDELDDCPDCGQKHLLPDWGSPHGRGCASCGFVRNGSHPPESERVETREREFIRPG